MRTRSVQWLAVCGAVAVAACARNADLTDSLPPVVLSTLDLRTQSAGDTMQVAITLSEGPTRNVGSLTAEVLGSDAWRYVGCEAAQTDALLACKANGATVRVAAAWAGGTHAGALVTLSYVRVATSPAMPWRLTVLETHGTLGHSLMDSLLVKGGAP